MCVCVCVCVCVVCVCRQQSRLETAGFFFFNQQTVLEQAKQF